MELQRQQSRTFWTPIVSDTRTAIVCSNLFYRGNWLSFFLSFFGLFLSSLFVFVSTVSFGSETVTKRNKALTVTKRNKALRWTMSNKAEHQGFRSAGTEHIPTPPGLSPGQLAAGPGTALNDQYRFSVWAHFSTETDPKYLAKR